MIKVFQTALLSMSLLLVTCEQLHDYPRLKSYGGTPPDFRFPLQLCEGDCDVDEDCDHGLICFQRATGGIEVPGCQGGHKDQSRTDYCVHASIGHQPTPNPTKAPHLRPTPKPTPKPTPTPTSPPANSELCNANSACAALGLTGKCCPTPDGVTLDCCGEQEGGGGGGGGMMAACSANPMCSNLGGNCCPTDDGVQLSCCGAD